MALLNQSTQVSAQLGKFFEKIREGQAPSNFTRAFLKDLGFKSSNHLAFIPLLKGLQFLNSDGTPTQRYRDFLDGTRWRKVLGEALREAYSDIFVLKAKPTKDDIKSIAGKYKSTYNMSDLAADRAARTFIALLELAGDDVSSGSKQEEAVVPPSTAREPLEDERKKEATWKGATDFGLNYNIQIHLPATKDLEVYNAIFKSLREHLID